MIDNCKEQILSDVVRVDLVLASQCDLIVPYQVRISEMISTKVVSGQTVSRIGTPGLSIAFSVQDGDEGEMESAPTFKQSEKQQASGVVVSHDLQVPIVAGFKETRAAVDSLQTRHFHVVLTTADGTRYLLYSLPGTSLLLLDEQDVNQRTTVKVTLQSKSHVIKLI